MEDPGIPLERNLYGHPLAGLLRVNTTPKMQWKYSENICENIKKRQPHGHRYGKRPGDRECHITHQLKKCKKKYYQGIHDRFVRDDKFRRNMIEIGRTEDLCRQMDDLADEDHTHHLTPQEVDTEIIGGFVQTRQESHHGDVPSAD